MNEPGTVEQTELISQSFSYNDTPLDVFRRRSAAWPLGAVGLLFLVLVGGCMYVLIVAALGKTDPANERVLSVSQSILTTSIGFLSGAATTVINFFFQPREK